MSLTSCFKYIMELPAATLNGMMQGVLQEADAANVQTSVHVANVAVGGYTATVDAQLDVTTNPPILELGAPDLSLVLHSHMNMQVAVNEIAKLDPITYQLAFDFPGEFQKQPVNPPILVMVFPGLTPGVLNLNVTGGNVVLTPALLEPRVHALYAQHPELAHSVQTGVQTPLPSPDNTWAVTVDIYDDTPGSMNFRGQITVDVIDATHIKLNLPGHLRAQNISTIRIDSDITVHVVVTIVPSDGKITIALSQVMPGNVTVDFTSPNFYTSAGTSVIAAQFASAIAALGHPNDPFVSVPTQQQIKDAITQQLIQYGSNLTVPIFKSTPPAKANDMDLTTFVPTTVQTQLLALQLEQQPVACDTPDIFLSGSQFAVSVDKEKCNSIIKPVVGSEEGSRQNIQGHDVSLSRLKASLSNPGDHGIAQGHIWISGLATVHLSCWPDAHINFSGPITLTPDVQNGEIKFHAHAGQFTADDPCCGSVDPKAIASFIEGQQNYPPITGLPSNFGGVGEIDIVLTDVDIFAAGIVLRGTLSVITTHSLQANVIQHSVYWRSDRSGGG